MSIYDSVKSPLKTARIAGILYLIITICAGFSEGFVRSSVIVAGDAVQTAENIKNAEMLFRFGFISDLIAFASDLAVTVLLYVLLKPVNKTVALVAASFRLVAHPAIATVNLMNSFFPLLMLEGVNYLTVFDISHLQALSLLFLNLHGYGYLVGGVFFGIHLILLGYLIYNSSYFPRFFGILMVIAGAGYLTESFGNFLNPDLKGVLIWFVAIPAVVAEFGFTLYLIIKGLNIKAWTKKIGIE